MAKKKDQLVGKQLGDYKLTGVLATGGMARIYQAEDANLGRKAAVKVLLQDQPDPDKQLARRFEREAKAIAALDHENIIPIYQFREQDGVYFLAMKYVEGHDLASELSTAAEHNRLLDTRRALRILEQVASALDHAHQKGVIHRDVKPSNILISEENDRAILTDFGLVLAESVDKTMGTAFGTPRYIAPEQAIASEKAVPQSDIYSLAVVAYELFTGQTPFTGDTPMEIALSHVSDPPPKPRSINPRIPAAVEKELLRALEKEPEKRHNSATAFVEVLRSGFGIVNTAPTPSEPLREGVAAALKSSMDVTPKRNRSAASKSGQSVMKDDRTTPPRADSLQKAKQPRKRRGVAFPLVGGLVILVAVVAVLAASAGNGGTIGTTESTQQSNGTQDVSANGVNPPAGATTEAGEVIVQFIYEANSLFIINPSSSELLVETLRFIRDDQTFTSRGLNIPQQIIPPGECVRIVRQGMTPPNSPANCTSVHSSTTLPFDSLFWYTASGSAQFSIFDGDIRLGTCNAVARGGSNTCTVNWSKLGSSG